MRIVVATWHPDLVEKTLHALFDEVSLVLQAQDKAVFDVDHPIRGESHSSAIGLLQRKGLEVNIVDR